MRIGILTFSKSINYGAALQAVALKHTVESFNEDVSVIDHPCKQIDSSSKIFDFSYIMSPSYVVTHIVNMPIAIKRTIAFKRFCKEHFEYGSDNFENYDKIIVGSDQVWNYNLTGDDMFYFLDFKSDNLKKFAYAASFGLSEIDNDHRKRIAPLIEEFDAISVREKTGADLVNQMTGKDVPVVVDPTLLFDKSRWAEYANKKFEHKGYIFVYTVFNSKPLWEFAYKLSEKTGLPIRTISYSKFHRHKAKYSFFAGPDEWLSHIMNAEYVVTNSFHGLVFSMNFEKQFYFEMPPETSGVGSRLKDTAETFKVIHRNINSGNHTPVDYSVVTPLIESARKESLEFIKKIINQ